MSILIKGMEMPENCTLCPIITWYDGDGDYVCPFSGVSALNIGRQDDCPLVPVPPHGRLIDLDEIALAQYYDEEHEEWSMKTVTVEDILWEVCENMPPIVIHADKDGES